MKKSRIFQVVFTALVTTLLTAPHAFASLILHYEIDSATAVANTMEDTSPTQENDGLRGGGGNFPLVADRFGNANSAVNVTGNNGIAVTNTNGIAASGKFTVMGWYKGTDSGFFFDQQTTRFAPQVTATTMDVHFSGTNYGTSTGTSSPSDGAWHHLAYVVDNNGVDAIFSVYLDGLAIDVDSGTPGMQTTRTMTGKGIASLTQQGTNGRQRFGNRFDSTASSLVGHYDDIRVYSTALTAEEVFEVAFPPLPEPSTLVLAVLGLVGLALRRRRRK